MNRSAKQHLDKAAGYVLKSEEFHSKAADEIAEAMDADPMLTQREIGEYIGNKVRRKPYSPDWVARIVAWDTAADRDRTPFGGEAAQESRERSVTKKTLRESRPSEIKELLDDPAVRMNITKALDQRYTQEAKAAERRRQEREVEDAGGAEEFSKRDRRKRIAEVVSVVRGAESGLRFAAGQAKGLELEDADPSAVDALASSLEAIIGFSQMLLDYLDGDEITDARLAQWIGGAS